MRGIPLAVPSPRTGYAARMTAPRIDLTDPASFVQGQPHALFRWLRQHAPVHWHAERNGPGFFAVTRHADVCEVGRDPATYSSAPTILIAALPETAAAGSASSDAA
jgi:cytochrome P450